MLGNLLDTPGKELWATLEKFAQRGVSRKDWEVLRANNGNNRQMDLVVEAMLARRRIRTRTFKVRINFSKPIEEKTATGFTSVDPNIISNNFPVNQTGEMEVEAVAVNFGKVVFRDEVLRSFKEMELQTGIPTLLADTSNQHQTKELDECLPLVAPDPVWVVAGGHENFAYLHGGVGRRELSLNYAVGGLEGVYWFLGFRKCQ